MRLWVTTIAGILGGYFWLRMGGDEFLLLMTPLVLILAIAVVAIKTDRLSETLFGLLLGTFLAAFITY